MACDNLTYKGARKYLENWFRRDIIHSGWRNQHI